LPSFDRPPVGVNRGATPGRAGQQAPDRTRTTRWWLSRPASAREQRRPAPRTAGIRPLARVANRSAGRAGPAAGCPPTSGRGPARERRRRARPACGPRWPPRGTPRPEAGGQPYRPARLRGSRRAPRRWQPGSSLVVARRCPRRQVVAPARPAPAGAQGERVVGGQHPPDAFVEERERFPSRVAHLVPLGQAAVGGLLEELDG